jgi:hypothetical protein
MSLTAAMAKLMATVERLNMRTAMASEPLTVPRWRVRAHTVQKTTFMRRQMGEPEVRYLRTLLAAPDAVSALKAYQSTHGRVLRPKRASIEAKPDVIDTSWRQRTPRYLSAEDLMRSQLQGRALTKELRRL